MFLNKHSAPCLYLSVNGPGWGLECVYEADPSPWIFWISKGW